MEVDDRLPVLLWQHGNEQFSRCLSRQLGNFRAISSGEGLFGVVAPSGVDYSYTYSSVDPATTAGRCYVTWYTSFCFLHLIR